MHPARLRATVYKLACHRCHPSKSRNDSSHAGMALNRYHSGLGKLLLRHEDNLTEPVTAHPVPVPRLWRQLGRSINL